MVKMVILLCVSYHNWKKKQQTLCGKYCPHFSEEETETQEIEHL